jgi:hypothetical protein
MYKPENGTEDRVKRSMVLVMALWAGAACAPFDSVVERVRPGRTAGDSVDAGTVDGDTMEEAGTSTVALSPPASPLDVLPGPDGDSAVWHRAMIEDGERIVVSREGKWLWLMRGDSAVFAAPVAVGRDTIFHYAGTAYDFSTPSGRMVVLDKETSPEWVPPNWHYYELAVERDLEPVHLKPDDRHALSDSTVIELHGKEVGRVNRFGNWRAFTPGSMIIFDDKIFIPPIGSPQRRIPEVLGTHRLILGDGYLIHGTPEIDTIGTEASHGCVRMFNHDVEALYGMVEAGVPVYIY